MTIDAWRIPLTFEEVNEYRQKHGLPLMTSKKRLIREKKLQLISDIRQSEDIHAKVNFILDIIADSVRNE